MKSKLYSNTPQGAGRATLTNHQHISRAWNRDLNKQSTETTHDIWTTPNHRHHTDGISAHCRAIPASVAYIGRMQTPSSSIEQSIIKAQPIFFHPMYISEALLRYAVNDARATRQDRSAWYTSLLKVWYRFDNRQNIGGAHAERCHNVICETHPRKMFNSR